jgi:HSP20 family molecular chaperone IbpA
MLAESVKFGPGPFLPLDAIDVSHAGNPEIRKEKSGRAGDFGEPAHGYDCCMARQGDLDRLRTEMEELFADLCQVPRLVAPRRGFRPRVDVYRTEDPPAITVVVELAGIEPDQVELAVSEGVLVIRGNRRRSSGRGRTYQHMEIDYGAFERQIALGESIDSDGAEATYEVGLLSIRLPVTQRPTAPVRVNVRRESA